MRTPPKPLDGFTMLLIGVLTVVAVAVGYFVLVSLFVPVDARGTFGDTFGALTAMFSGLAFAGLIYTIGLQRQELGLQRVELRETREEMARARVAHEASAKAQGDLVERQLLTARIQGLSGIVQGRYQIAAAHPQSNHSIQVNVRTAEKTLVEWLNQAGADNLVVNKMV